MEAKSVVAALRAQWWVVIVAALVGSAIAGGVSFSRTPVYASHTQFFVSTTDSSTTAEVFQGGQFSQQRVASYAQLLTGERLAGRVGATLGLNESTDAISRKISATAAADTVLLNVTVSDPSPRQAQLIARTLGQEFVELVDELESPGAGANSPVRVAVVEDANLPTAPTSPRHARDIALGLAAGLVVGAAAVVLRR